LAEIISDKGVASGLQFTGQNRHATPEQAMSFHYVYILRSIAAPDRYYVGLTRHLESRLSEHNRGETPSTKAYAPWQIEIATAFRDYAKAAAFEQYLKTHSGRAFSKRHF
jgi:putative endonuclease